MQPEKNSARLNARSHGSGRPLKPSSIALIALSALCVMSCGTKKMVTAPEQTDSLRAMSSVLVEQTSVVEPARLDTAAELQISPAQIDSLPVGAEYSVQTAQARAALIKHSSGGVTLSAQGISPAKVATTSKVEADASAKAADHYKPPEAHLKADKETAKWYQDGFVIGTLLFAILSIAAIVWAGRKN